MLLCNGPQPLCYDQTRRTSPHSGSRPIKWSSGKGGCRLYSFHITTDPTEDHIPLPGTGSRTKQPLSILRTGSGKGHNKKVVMHSLAGFNFGARACTKTISVEMRVVILNFLFRSFMVGFLFIVMPSKFSFLTTTHAVSGAFSRFYARIEVGSLMHMMRMVVWVDWVPVVVVVE